MSEVTDNPDRKRWGIPRAPGWVAVLAILLPVLYVMTMGPAWKIGHALGAWSTVRVLYAPVLWLVDISDPFAGFIQWYLHDVWKV